MTLEETYVDELLETYGTQIEIMKTWTEKQWLEYKIQTRGYHELSERGLEFVEQWEGWLVFVLACFAGMPGDWRPSPSSVEVYQEELREEADQYDQDDFGCFIKGRVRNFARDAAYARERNLRFEGEEFVSD